jgi:hypothetical protein
VYKADNTTFTATKFKTPELCLHHQDIFMIAREAIYILYPRPKAHVNTRKKLHFSWMSSGIVPSPQSSDPVRLLPSISSCG